MLEQRPMIPTLMKRSHLNSRETKIHGRLDAVHDAASCRCAAFPMQKETGEGCQGDASRRPSRRVDTTTSTSPIRFTYAPRPPRGVCLPTDASSRNEHNSRIHLSRDPADFSRPSAENVAEKIDMEERTPRRS